ncbi:hypothetical protein H4582DRAFT_1909837 [Lactarius indigo]|nr:hypothetical protein H4582DRAFT_1909837 [Lactarius indigo]
MTCMTTASSNVSANQSNVSQSCEVSLALPCASCQRANKVPRWQFTTVPQRISTTSTGFQGNVRSIDSCRSYSQSASDPSRVSRPRLSRGSCHTPDPSATPRSRPPVAFVDHDSGVVISNLYTASGERITTQEFQSKPHRVLAPTLYLVIPSNTSTAAAATAVLPNFALTLPSPISSTSSPVLLPSFSPFTQRVLPSPPACSCASLLARPQSSRTSVARTLLFRLPRATSAAPQQPTRRCALCSTQQLACEIWWAASTPTTRAVYYALGLPLGRLERACVDRDVVAAISFMRQPPRVRNSSSASSSGSGVGVKSKPVVVVTRAPAPIAHTTAPAKVPMIPIPVIPRRRVIVRP